MVIQAYTSGYGELVGQIQTSLVSLPKLQNGYYLNPISAITTSLASVGADPTQPYWIDWDLTTVCSSSANNRPILQSPLFSTYQGIVAFLSGGAVRDQHFINFQSQRFSTHGFWNLKPAAGYPSAPPSPISGQVNIITSSLATQTVPGDSACIYPQYAIPLVIDVFVNFRATLVTYASPLFLSDFPSLFAEFF
jgi:hypothetical protein